MCEESQVAADHPKSEKIAENMIKKEILLSQSCFVYRGWIQKAMTMEIIAEWKRFKDDRLSKKGLSVNLRFTECWQIKVKNN